MKTLSMSCKRFLCRLMVVVMIVCQLPITSLAATITSSDGKKQYFNGAKVTDYRAWSQDQATWGLEKIGTSKKYGSFNYSGDLLTAFAKLSVQLGKETTKTTNPGIVNTTLTKEEIVNSNGRVTSWSKAAALLDMKYEGKIKYKDIISYLKKSDKKYGVILKVANKDHYVLVDKETTLAKNAVYVHDSKSTDPAAGKSSTKKSWMSTSAAATEKKYKTLYTTEAKYISNLASKKYSSRFGSKTPTEVLLFSVAEEVKVTLNANGGKVTTSSLVVDKGSNYYAKLPTPTRSGYTFSGWYTKKTNGTKIVKSKAVASKATTLYAHWKKNPSYKVTLNANGGTASKKSITVTSGLTYSGLPTPTRTGYTFDGWYTKKTGGTKITSSTEVTITAKQTLYAHWLKNYKVTFNATGGKVSGKSSASKTVVQGKTYASLPTPTRTGYTFNGWYTAKTGGTKVTVSTKVTKDHTLYARWTKNVYKVTLDANGGTVSSTVLSVNYGEKLPELPTPTNSNHSFMGWYTASSGGTKVEPGTKVTKSMTLYAQWSSCNHRYLWGYCRKCKYEWPYMDHIEKIEPTQYRVSVTGTYIRSRPYIDEIKLLAQLAYFDEVTVVGKVTTKEDGWVWYQIEGGGFIIDLNLMEAVECTDHLEYDEAGYCKACGYEWPWRGKVERASWKRYKVKSSYANFYGRPYAVSSKVADTLSKGERFNISSEVKNCFGELWYETETGLWVKASDLKWCLW